MKNVIVAYKSIKIIICKTVDIISIIPKYNAMIGKIYINFYVSKPYTIYTAKLESWFWRNLSSLCDVIKFEPK